MKDQHHFSLISLGCARTLVDSEKLVQSLQHVGFNLVAEGTSEAITILNTCSFIESAIIETEENIHHLSQKKEKGEIKYVVIVGCYPSRFKKHELEAKFPDVDLWLTTKQESTLHNELIKLVFNKKFSPTQSQAYTKLTPSHYSYLKISEGCDNWCSFCTIPKIRGTHTSRSIDDILKEVRLQQSFGAKELCLIAEDTTAWGEDLFGSPQFPRLLKELGKTDVPWIRPMYIFPSRVNDELIQTIAETPNITRYIDIPIQHVNDDLLRSMNRRHDKAFLESILKKFRAAIPDMAFRTTFIIGYPGETEAHVDELIAFITEFPFAHIGCFGYSEERETRSARLKEKVDPDTIRARINRIMETQYMILQDRHKKRIGKIETLLYEGNGIGRTQYEAPEVDAVITLQNQTENKTLIPGTFYTVKITGSNGYDLMGDVLQEAVSFA